MNRHLSDRQQEIANGMAAGKWYNATQLGTSPQCLRRMGWAGAVKRRKAVDLDGHKMKYGYIVNSYEYQLV
jgi:hypothetical protein